MDIELLTTFSNLPINALLFIVIYFLWKKMETIQGKYENLLREVGKLEGFQELENRISSKLDILISK